MAERGDPDASERASGGEAAGTEVSWERFSQWVCCVCVVTFDLELGQAMEVYAIDS